MATIRPPLYKPPPPLKSNFPSLATWISCTPIYDSSSSSSAFFMASNFHKQPGQHVAVSVAFNPSSNYDLSLYEDDEDTEKISPPIPPTEGRFEVLIDNDVIRRLDLTPFHTATGITSANSTKAKEYLERTIGFSIKYTREDEYDPRELSEFPDIRLWFVRLDATYPWLPVLLDWRAGELARYAAMLVPHQMSMKMGVVFNPEALELFIMEKVFIVYSWLKQQDVSIARSKTKDMARMLGFGIGDELFDLIDNHPSTPS